MVEMIAVANLLRGENSGDEMSCRVSGATARRLLMESIGNGGMKLQLDLNGSQTIFLVIYRTGKELVALVIAPTFALSRNYSFLHFVCMAPFRLPLGVSQISLFSI